MCIYFTVLFTVYKCHCVNMLCSPLAEENKVSIYHGTLKLDKPTLFTTSFL